MSEKEPSWRLLVPPQFCDKCGKPYSEKNFDMRSVNADIDLLSRQYCSWCKECDSQFMDEGEHK